MIPTRFKDFKRHLESKNYQFQRKAAFEELESLIPPMYDMDSRAFR